jgi:hypothetical protein
MTALMYKPRVWRGTKEVVLAMHNLMAALQSGQHTHDLSIHTLPVLVYMHALLCKR